MEPIICNGARMWAHQAYGIGDISDWCKEHYGTYPAILPASAPSILQTVEFGSKVRAAAEKTVFVSIIVYSRTNYLYTFFCTANENAAAHFKLVW